MGIPEIDSLAGGLPRGGLTEICGPPCSGRTSLLISALAERTAQDEACALVDGRDTFDPYSAQVAGVELKKLLWARCRNIDQAFRATDLLVQGGGFGLIALDLSDIPAETVRYIPLNAWFRFRRAVEDTPTILIVVEQEPNAKTCASLVLQLGSERAQWSTAAENLDSARYHPCLMESFQIRAQVIRSRMQAGKVEAHFDLRKTGTSAERFASASAKELPDISRFSLEEIDGSTDNFRADAPARSFQTKTMWSDRSRTPAALEKAREKIPQKR